MDYNKLADLIFADITDTVDDLEKRFPERNLPEGARVTRFAQALQDICTSADCMLP